MSFAYHRPCSLAEAVELAGREGAAIIAGGTDLLVKIKKRLAEPALLVDLRFLSELKGVDLRPGGELQIGPLLTHAEAQRHPLLCSRAGPLPAACSEVGSPQIRNLGTLGGNLANASPAGDTLPALLALEARLELTGPGGTRWVAGERFFAGPGRTVLERGEIITAIEIPDHPPGPSFFLKAGQRKALAISKVAVAGLLELEPLPNGVGVRRARLALGAVAPTPIRAYRAEEYLQGRELTPTTVAEAARLAAWECQPIDDLRAPAWYRRRLVEVLLRRGLLSCLPPEEGERLRSA